MRKSGIPQKVKERLTTDNSRSYLSLIQNRKVVWWLDDSIEISDINLGGRYSDYSFMVTPAFKALEQWLINIAPYLGVDEDKIEAAKSFGKFGSFLGKGDNKLESLKEDIEKRLKLKAEDSRKLADALESLLPMLKRYRHGPAHCSSPNIENPAQARTKISTIIDVIDSHTDILVELKILPTSEETIRPIFDEEKDGEKNKVDRMISPNK